MLRFLPQALRHELPPVAIASPDLLPIPRSDGMVGAPAESFCDLDPATGELLVRVRNQGSGSSLRSTVTRVITFPSRLPGGMSRSEVAERLTPVLGPGEEAVLRFHIAFSGRRFSITVDATNLLPEELHKGNNTVMGFCPLPPGSPALPPCP